MTDGFAPHSRRLLLLSTSLNLGGAEMQVFLLARTLVQRGWQVVVVSMVKPLHFVAELREAGVAVHSLDMTPGRPSPQAVHRLARIYRQFRPDVVHSHMFHANLLGRALKLLFPRIPLISTAHDHDETLGRLSRYLPYRLTRSASDFMSNVSSASFTHYVERGLIAPDRGAALVNGLDLSRFDSSRTDRQAARQALGLDPGTFCWCAMGRLVSKKDYPTLIRAVQWLAAQHASMPFKVLVAGEGPLLASLQQLAADCGLDQTVSFLGLRKDVPALLTAADGFVMSSLMEGLPMAMLEAMSMRRICVGTDTGGIRGLLAPVAEELVVPSGRPEALARAMQRVMHLPPAERTRLESLSRATVQARYDMQTVTSTWEEIYQRFLPSTGQTILHVVEAFGAGVSHHLHQVCSDPLPGQRYVVAHGPRDFHHALAQQMPHVEFVPWRAQREPSFVADAHSLVDLQRIISTRRPSLVHAHSSKAGVHARLVARMCGIPCVYTPNAYAFLRDDVGPGQQRFFRLAERILAPLATTVACGEEEHAWARSFSRRAVLAENGVDTSLFRPGASRAADADGPRVMCVGRRSPQKDFPFFQQVAAHPACRHLRFVWVTGEDQDDQSVSGNVRVLGQRAPAEMVELYQSAHLYLNTSRWEGLSLAALEAAATGLPLVLRDCPGNRELARRLPDAETFCTVDDAAQAIARRLPAGTSLPPVSLANAAAVAATYSANHLRQRLRQTYRVVLAERSRRG